MRERGERKRERRETEEREGERGREGRERKREREREGAELVSFASLRAPATVEGPPASLPTPLKLFNTRSLHLYPSIFRFTPRLPLTRPPLPPPSVASSSTPPPDLRPYRRPPQWRVCEALSLGGLPGEKSLPPSLPSFTPLLFLPSCRCTDISRSLHPASNPSVRGRIDRPTEGDFFFFSFLHGEVICARSFIRGNKMAPGGEKRGRRGVGSVSYRL